MPVKYIRPWMYRALVSLYEDELEYNNKIIESRIVLPIECISGSEEQPIYGSAWSLDYEYVLNSVGEDKEYLHAILRKKVTIQCVDGEMEITDPKGCYILDEEAEGVYIVCISNITLEKHEIAYINKNVKYKFKGKWHKKK